MPPAAESSVAWIRGPVRQPPRDANVGRVGGGRAAVEAVVVAVPVAEAVADEDGGG
jgi:hypothetical protein